MSDPVRELSETTSHDVSSMTEPSRGTGGENEKLKTPRRSTAVQILRRVFVWLNKEAILRVWWVVSGVGLSIIVMLSVLTQQATLAEHSRVKDVHNAAVARFLLGEEVYSQQVEIFNACIAKVETRDNVRSVLLKIVDLKDVLPDSAAALAYEQARQNAIDVLLPPINKESCGHAPDKPVAADGLFP